MNKNNENKLVESPNLALNKYLQQKAKISMQGSLRWKTYLFPVHSKSTSFAKSTQKYFGLDLVDEEKERSYWAHKASVWQDLFEGVNHIAETENIDGMGHEFDGIFAAGLQAEPKGPNEIKNLSPHTINISSNGSCWFLCLLTWNTLNIFQNFLASFNLYAKCH